MLYSYKPMPRPRSLSHASIAAAALAVIDRGGLDALSMRAIAAELGMGVMSLYRYVADRREIEVLVVDLFFQGLAEPVPGERSWQQQIVELSGRARAAAAAHPAVIPLVLSHHEYSPSAWRWSESMLTALDQAGFAGQDRVIAFRCLQSYILGWAQARSLGPLDGPRTAVLAALSPQTYPLLAETAGHAFGITAEEEFARGLAIVLDGLRRSPAPTDPAGRS